MSTNSMGDGSGAERQQQIPDFFNFVKPDGASSSSSNLPTQSPLLDRLKQFLPQIAEANAKLEAERAEEKQQAISVEPQIDCQFDSDDDEEESGEGSSSSEESPSGEESGSGKEDNSEEEDSDQEKTQQQQRSTQFIEFDVHLIREGPPKMNGNEGKKAAPLVEEIEKHGA